MFLIVNSAFTGFFELERRQCSLDQLVVEHLLEAVILRLAMIDRDALAGGRLVEHLVEVEPARLPVMDRAILVEPIRLADELRELAIAHGGHHLAHFLGDEEEVVDDVLRRAREAGAQDRILRRDADRAGVEMALAHHDAAGRDQRRGREAELVRAEQRADDHVTPRAQAAVDLHRDASAQPVDHQCLMRFGKADFPRAAGMLERRQRRSARAAFVAGDGDVIRARLGNAGRNGADAHFRHELHRHRTLGVGVLEIEDELREIFDRIDIVMRRRRDQANAGRRMAHAGDSLVDLMAGQLSALAGLCALRHLDLHHVRVDEVFRRHAEPARSDLLDGRAHAVAVRQRLEPVRFLAALARVRLAADAVHRDGERGVRLARDRAEAHRAGCEALDDLCGGLDFLDRDRRPSHAFRRADTEHAADRQKLLGLRVDCARVVAILLRILPAMASALSVERTACCRSATTAGRQTCASPRTR